MGQRNTAWLIAVLALSGCAPQVIPASKTIYVHTCPIRKHYTRRFEYAAGEQLATLPPHSPVVKMIEDYLALRHALKVGCPKD